MVVNEYLTPSERTAFDAVRVGIAGAGGLGSNCAMHLVRAGVRRLAVADFDVVSPSNLNRQFFFRDQIGMKKVDALRENLLKIDPDADVRVLDAKLDAESSIGFFADCDIVVEAFDSAESKAMLIAAFASSGKRIVTASGIAGWGRSNRIRLKMMGGRIAAIGDAESEVGPGMAPASPRVGIAAAMEANAVVALILGMEP